MLNRTVVVTGGCGYIGSHVARAFKRRGDTVHIIDRVKRDHTLKEMDGWLIADFASDEALSFLVMLRPDIVVHCAGTSLVGPSMENPGEYYDNNISKTIRMLNVVKDITAKNSALAPAIMFSSSASIYGHPYDDSLLTEDYQGIPISPYGNTKAMTETILRDYWGAYAVQSICFRYFNAAGAEPVNFDLGQEPGATHVIARALEASINDQAFSIYGTDYVTTDHTAVRDYVHVWDIARAHVLGASYLLDDYPQMGAHVYNLSTGRGTSVLEIANYVNEKYGLPAVNYESKRMGDPPYLVASAKKARQQLGWEPHHSDISTIIDSAYKWYTQ
jgi:UDP-glucose-4-epimerase GalE